MSSGFGSIRSFLRDFEVVSSGQGPHQHRRLSFCDFSDSDDESLFDNYCGLHPFHVWSPQSQTLQYRLHYGPHIENIENQFEQHDDLFKDPSADDLATDEQEFQELDDEVAQTVAQVSRTIFVTLNAKTA
ncbi:hypothetical protein BGZ98_005194 [Dissophora globulifera]|nr:hypothetical protein BGZ98_005194 [Dissophora globulifera]